MNIAIIIGKHNSSGVPGKNYVEVLGRPMVEYSLLAAKNCKLIDHIYVSTDSEIIKDIALKYNATIIHRSEQLSQSETPTEDVYKHAFDIIKQEHQSINYLFLMFANCPDISPQLWEQASELLDNNLDFDSVMSISKFNMFSPLRARTINSDGSTDPMLELKELNLKGTFDRDAMGDCFFADFAVQVVRPKCLENIESASLPFLWLGNKQGYIIKDFGFDVDAAWQIPVIEYSLRQMGFTETITPYKED
jgi:CMP-N-acetylneuraminic acid synthetase